jgi:hypothetical protein
MTLLLNNVKLFSSKNVLFFTIAFNLVISLKLIEASPRNLDLEPSTTEEFSITAESSTTVESSTTAEPSTTAESTTKAEPSTTAEFSTTANPSSTAEPTFKIDDFIKNDSIRFGHPEDNVIKIATASCGQSIMEETLVMLKSAIIFAQSNLHFIIVAEDSKRDICKKVSNLNYLNCSNLYFLKVYK